ncbi:hypothetical protein E1301_Tti015670 [Triplophysa tibetana]|uniref:Uncharacterized protein n=1 Tax=Triplophysa tibetana TaxID=1572043 RepID=A0A5A9N1D2_9TELE|nr:hypothetical protein E1301_Tti015670 [Triplophysa tibetana]
MSLSPTESDTPSPPKVAEEESIYKVSSILDSSLAGRGSARRAGLESLGVGAFTSALGEVVPNELFLCPDPDMEAKYEPVSIVSEAVCEPSTCPEPAMEADYELV